MFTLVLLATSFIRQAITHVYIWTCGAVENVGDMAQEKHLLQSFQGKQETMQHPCLVASSVTDKTVQFQNNLNVYAPLNSDKQSDKTEDVVKSSFCIFYSHSKISKLSSTSVGQTVGSRAKNSWAKMSSKLAESCQYKGMGAKISSIYDMGGFKPILTVEGGKFIVFSSMHMKA